MIERDRLILRAAVLYGEIVPGDPVTGGTEPFAVIKRDLQHLTSLGLLAVHEDILGETWKATPAGETAIREVAA